MNGKSGEQSLESGLSHAFSDREDPLARILDLADDAIISVDADQSIILFNQGAEKMFGYSSSEVSGKQLEILLPPHVANVHRTHVQEFNRSSQTARRMGERQKILGRRKDGTEFPAEASISKVALADGGTMFTVIMRDVTQRTLDDERLKASLREKEVLLEEVHHRVKNNLQVVSSLLGLQARSLSDPITRKTLQESQYRVQSMALLHECMYQSEDLARIDFATYLHRLTEQLFQSYGSSDRIQLKTQFARVHLNMDAAVPCGLIVNELLSNALKYGFPSDQRGEVRVELTEDDRHTATLTVADDGVGLPQDFDWSTSRTLRLRLVRTLALQLNAVVELNRDHGTIFSITFPMADPVGG